jgi:putative intracellular protease/amidase
LFRSISCEDCPPLDVVVVPGGPGQQHLMHDEAVLAFCAASPARRDM